MSRLPPLSIEELSEAEREAMRRAEDLMGFVANDALTMARNPALMQAFGALVDAVYAPGKIDSGFKRLLGLMTSSAAGCRYCMGHTSFASRRHGVDAVRLEAVWDFRGSELFSEAEKRRWK